jgi:hypothetical protein
MFRETFKSTKGNLNAFLENTECHCKYILTTELHLDRPEEYSDFQASPTGSSTWELLIRIQILVGHSKTADMKECTKTLKQHAQSLQHMI